MTKLPEFDLTAAHRYFSAECFNRAWDLIEKLGRTPDEDEEMLRLSLASTWHWTQRQDCTPSNLSVGYWQIARIYTLLGQVENARRYGALCLKAAQEGGAEPFTLGYAYEALARVEMVAGERARMEVYLEQAQRICENLTDEEDRQQLMKDLETIKLGS
ncbi:MAG: hypothetical protein A2W35_16085 [Chloroflexi bacterium RBG_16_57_11]|nr:MAG: hypothetical protein A2W35_16085 [Chloroflexi bacterium RBG_16_57_11]